MAVQNLNDSLRLALVAGASEMGVNLNEVQQELLLGYLQEFHKWNQAFNLSAIRDIRQMLARHLLDSLSVVPWFQQTGYPLARVIDVGTGGGLPGIPLAIMFPDTRFTLLDSNGKKTRFLFQVKTLLKLDNVTVENRRVEEFQPEQAFNAVISRAFASLEDMTRGCGHLLAPGGIFLAMKGLFPQDELSPIESSVRLVETHRLQVAETEGERHLLVLQPLST